MRRLTVFLLGLLMLPMLTACSGNGAQEETGPLEGSLRIYYSANPDAKQMIDSFMKENPELTVEATAFEEPSQMDARLTTETTVGQGPDVVIFTEDTTLDTLKMAFNGAFEDLAPRLAIDSEAYYPVLDAGRIGERQYLMPLRFRVTYLITSREKLAGEGLSLEAPYTMGELMQLVEQAAAQSGDDTSALQSLNPWTPGSLLYDALRLSDVPVTDFEEQTISLEQEELALYGEYARQGTEQIHKSAQILQTYSRDFIGAFSRLTLMLTDSALPYTLRQYDSIFAYGLSEELRVLPYYDKTGEGIVGDVCLYTAVLQGSQNPRAACAFVRSAMDSAPSDPLAGDLCVSKAQTEVILKSLSASSGKGMNIGVKNIPISALSQERREETEKILAAVSSGSIRSQAVEEILSQSMTGYLEGTAALDSCYREMCNKLELYLYE